MSTLHRVITMEGVEEFTVEGNPESVDAVLMDVLASGRVNRVSLGAQSFNPTSLKVLERRHDQANVGRAVDLVRRYGIDNINLDLIFAIPGQSLAMLEADLDAALALEPEHLSCYHLTYEPETALTARLQRGLVQAVPDDLSQAMYECVMTRLDSAGYEHYEISNWARRDGASSPSLFRCQHNLAYWRNENWLGFGPSAASHVDGHRWKHPSNVTRYISEAPFPSCVDNECLPPDSRIGETLMLGLRLREGMELAWLDTHVPRDDARWQSIDELIAFGMLERRESRLRLTRRGLFVADSVIQKLL